MWIGVKSIKQYFCCNSLSKSTEKSCIAYCFRKKNMLNVVLVASGKAGFLSFELVGFADFELFNVELTDNSQLQIQKILMREAH